MSQNQELETMRHSFAHVLAQAVLRIYPDAKLGIGPAVENGFYYEFEINEEKEKIDLKQIEREIRKIIEEELPIVQLMIPREEAFDMLHLQGQIYKTELLQEIPEEEISFYKTGEEFIDLCRGPHVAHTGKLGVFKLTAIEDVHWRDNENRPILYKISGIAFKEQKELEEYLKWEEEKFEKEHKFIGPRRKYFTIREQTGEGLPIWLEEGAKVQNLIMEFIREQRLKRDYIEVSTPNIAKVALFKETGYLEFYQELDIRPFNIDQNLYMLRPMATPSHIEVFRSQRRGYSTMPLKMFEFARVYRNEEKEQLQGLVRTREFTQDTAHIFTTPEQISEEIQKLLNFTIILLKAFGFSEFQLELARRNKDKPEDYLGTEEVWEQAESILIKALEKAKLVAREAEGEAEFYGPKIDFLVKDIFGKEWQVSTIQLDLIIPERCQLKYVDKDGDEKIPYLIHHSAIGSLERFFALLIEHYVSALPVWLSPTQAIVLPISQDFNEYGQAVKNQLTELGMRTTIDARSETLQNKIREAQLAQVPYMIIVGKQEETSEVISVRPRSGEDLGVMRISEFQEKFLQDLHKT